MASGFGAFAQGLGKVGQGIGAGVSKIGSGIGAGVSKVGKEIPGGWKGGLQRVMTGDMEAGKPAAKALPTGPTKTYEPYNSATAGANGEVPISQVGLQGQTSGIAGANPSIKKPGMRQKIGKGLMNAGDTIKGMTPPPADNAEAEMPAYNANWRMFPGKKKK
jgi:hypothetical protein